MNCIIVDDEPRNIEILSKLLSNFCPEINIKGTAGNITEAEELIKVYQPNLVFLDIEMPGGSGFDLIDKLLPIDFEVVFITAFDGYMLKAFRYAALDYLLKPVDIDELKQAIEKAKERMSQANLNLQFQSLLQHLNQETKLSAKSIALPNSDGIDFVVISEIVKVEVSGSYTTLYTATQKIVTTKSLKEFEELLPKTDFFRVNFSTIVNISFVKKYHKGRGGYIEMRNGDQVEIATRRKQDF